MAVVFAGVANAAWSVPTWVARNAIFFLEPSLRRTHAGHLLADRLRADWIAEASMIALDDLLADPQQAAAWRTAIHAALQTIDAENPQDWHIPAVQPVFRAAFCRLLDLAPRGVEESYSTMLDAASALDRIQNATAIFKSAPSS